MRLFVAVTCLLVGCLAQQPRQCRAPPFLSGGISVTTQNEQLWSVARYEYDALGQRIRVREIGAYDNKTFTYDGLLHYREGVLYEINNKARRCKKRPLKEDFRPWEIPRNATFFSQFILGSSSGPGQGLLVNAWTGELPPSGAPFFSTVTEFGCIPVATSYDTDQFGWVVVSFFDTVIGIVDPNALNPPRFCERGSENFLSEEEPADLLSLFHKKYQDIP
ncbi:uncharacterized protein V6R79_013153 [Siganus canaliculatus]